MGERISDEVIDQLLAGARTEEEIAGPGGLLAQLTKRLIERAMEVELTDHHARRGSPTRTRAADTGSKRARARTRSSRFALTHRSLDQPGLRSARTAPLCAPRGNFET